MHRFYQKWMPRWHWSINTKLPPTSLVSHCFEKRNHQFANWTTTIKPLLLYEEDTRTGSIPSTPWDTITQLDCFGTANFHMVLIIYFIKSFFLLDCNCQNCFSAASRRPIRQRPRPPVRVISEFDSPDGFRPQAKIFICWLRDFSLRIGHM